MAVQTQSGDTRKTSSGQNRLFQFEVPPATAFSMSPVRSTMRPR